MTVPRNPTRYVEDADNLYSIATKDRRIRKEAQARMSKDTTPN